MTFNDFHMNHNLVKSPCSKDCTKRKVGCHSQYCKEWMKYLIEKEEADKKVSEARNREALITSYTVNQMKENKKRNHSRSHNIAN